MTSEHDVQRNKKQIERELIEILIELDGYEGDFAHCYDEMEAYKLLIDKTKTRKDGLIRDWYNAE